MDQVNYEELAQEVIKQQQKANAQEQAPQSHKEAVISVLREKMIPYQIPQSQSAQPQAKQNIAQLQLDPNLPEYSATAPEASKQEVKDLIDFTLQKGLAAGIEKAAKSDPFVIDMYHDSLAEHVIAQMKQKGLL